ncbi:MAG: 16S rRNA methyltransferase [Peptococcaceae bacterium BICA1-7]|nr:MAG: 16S rRNA methyltransferase [Peptococcaceae bacterium BICA1-7]HBV98125.1 16S rRNA (uracil(1498)-N(3))-methyltransferase [Desulfotomaculum sp.]
MNRFFITSDQFNNERPLITGTDVKHAARVLRLGPGDSVVLLDGTGRAAVAVIEQIGKDHITCRKVNDFNPGGEPPIDVFLVQGLAKGEKMEYIIQKCTELGVSGIIPLVSRRSVVRLEGERIASRQSRWQRVALEASKQCRRSRIPEVFTPREMEDVLRNIPPGALSILPWEGERSTSLKDALPGTNPGKIYIFVGPEGGFEDSEVEEAQSSGVAVVSLGPRILRTETAGPACLAIIMHKWGDLG